MYRSEQAVCPVVSVSLATEWLKQGASHDGAAPAASGAGSDGSPDPAAAAARDPLPSDPRGIPARALARLRAVDACQHAYPDRPAHLALMREAVDRGRWPDAGQLSALMVRRQREAADGAQRGVMSAAAERARQEKLAMREVGLSELAAMRKEDMSVEAPFVAGGEDGDGNGQAGDGDGDGDGDLRRQHEDKEHAGVWEKRFEYAAAAGADYWHGAVPGRPGWVGARWIESAHKEEGSARPDASS